VWFLSKDALTERGVNDRHFLVQLTLFAVAGVGWALVQAGADRPLRAGLGLVAGAAVGIGGTFVLGTTEQHQDAAADAVFSGASFGRAALWTAIGAAAWAITIAAGTRRDRIAPAATGAALGGAATGRRWACWPARTCLAASVFATDIWWSYPLDGGDDGASAAPLLVAATVVPLLLASGAARAPRLQPIVAFGVAGCLLIPGLGGLAGYSTDIDEARRNGEEFEVSSSPGDLDSADAEADVDVDETTTSDPSDDNASSSATVDVGPAESAPPFTLPTVPAPSPATEAPPTPTTRPPAAPPTRPPATSPATVPSKVDPGYPVFVSSEILASNEQRQTATIYLLIGRPYRAGRAPAQVDGGVACAVGPNDAVIPFYLSATPTSGGSTNTVTLQFSSRSAESLTSTLTRSRSSSTMPATAAAAPVQRHRTSPPLKRPTNGRISPAVKNSSATATSSSPTNTAPPARRSAAGRPSCR